MTAENNPNKEKEDYDFFMDHFDLDTRKKIGVVAAAFGADFERLIFMARKRKGAETMTREELLSLLPEGARQESVSRERTEK